MLIGDLNLFIFFIFTLFFIFFYNTTNSLNTLVIAELMWITVFLVSLLVGFVYDNLNLLSLTFFVLIFSAVEFSIGLIIVFLQYLFTRTLSWDDIDFLDVKHTQKSNKNQRQHDLFRF